MIVLFGASGDIHKKKVYPGLYELFNKGTEFKIVGIGRSKYNKSSYQDLIMNSLKSNYPKDNIDKFVNCFDYIEGQYDDISTYTNLEKHINYGIKDKIILYCGVPSYVTLNIIKNIKKSGIYDRYNVVFMIEKPFGNNVNESKKYRKRILKYIKKDSVKLVDHYLAKSSIQNLDYLTNISIIDKIEINIYEEEGVDHRLSYFNDVGLVNDMFQSHILSIIAKLINNEFYHLTVPKNTESKIGQYNNYLGSNNIETYFKIVMCWKNIPIIIECGKKMSQSKKNIVIYFNSGWKCTKPIISTENEYGVMIDNILNDNDNCFLNYDDNIFYWKITENVKNMLKNKKLEYYNNNSIGINN